MVVLALGADIKNRFLIAKGKTLIFGPDIGDLSDASNYSKLKKSVKKALHGVKPDIIACDLHPGYFSSALAGEISLLSACRSLFNVQHHHAHIASVIHEHDIKGPVIGVSFDGTGYGADGNMWGGEFLLVERDGFRRLAYLKYRKMPGGERVIYEPWRMAVSILGERAAPFLKGVSRKDRNVVLRMLDRDINAPLTSGAGRVFDAAAAIIADYAYASREAEGPLRLEAMCGIGVDEAYEFDISKRDDAYEIDVEPVFTRVIRDIKGIGSPGNRGRVAAKFHNSMVRVIISTVKRLSNETGVKKVALSGGVFQNKYLIRRAINRLTSAGLKIYTNEKFPVNDLNISLGQYSVVSH